MIMAKLTLYIYIVLIESSNILSNNNVEFCKALKGKIHWPFYIRRPCAETNSGIEIAYACKVEGCLKLFVCYFFITDSDCIQLSFLFAWGVYYLPPWDLLGSLVYSH